MTSKTATPLTVDKTRRDQSGKTGVWVRARLHGRWYQADVAELDDASFGRWVTANPECRYVAALLGRPTPAA